MKSWSTLNLGNVVDQKPNAAELNLLSERYRKLKKLKNIDLIPKAPTDFLRRRLKRHLLNVVKPVSHLKNSLLWVHL